MELSSEYEEETDSGINLHDRAFQIDPYPTYEQMRLKPVCKVKPDNMWAVSRYADVKYLLLNPATFSSRALGMPYESEWLSEECRNPRLNHTRVCESRMEKAPVVALIEITRQGVDGNYKDLQKLFNDQYSRSVILLPHVMRQRIFPVIAVVEKKLVKTLGLDSDSEPVDCAK